MELKELGQLLKEYNSRVYRIRRLTMAKKFLKLDGDKLSQRMYRYVCGESSKLLLLRMILRGLMFLMIS